MVAQLISKESVDRIYVVKDGKRVTTISEVGKKETVSVGNGEYKVIGSLDGDEQLLEEKEFRNVVDESTLPHTEAPDCSSVEYEGKGTSNSPYEISNDHEFQCISKDKDAYYVLVNDIDASKTDQWNSGSGFNPIGDKGYNSNEFTGSIDGQGYKIDGLYIDRPSFRSLGLLTELDTATVRNLGLTNINIEGEDNVGGLVGITQDSER